jgi:predicted nucleotidyltransferase
LNHEGSDFDYRGFYVAPTRLLLGLTTPPEQVNGPGTDELYWEAGKFFRLVLENNPNVLEALFGETVEYTPSPMMNELLHRRNEFLSNRLVKTYGGYATSQLGFGMRMLNNPEQTRQGWKHLMHLLRLLLSGAYALRNGTLKVNVSEYPYLLDVRHGRMPLAEFQTLHAELEADFAQAKLESVLPETPNVQLAEELLVAFRVAAL